MADRPGDILRWKRPDRGQAMAELAIFGSIMLVVLAGVVRMGLQYFYQQQATQEAFRQALYYANDVNGKEVNKLPDGSKIRNNILGSGQVTVIHERYIPDPSRPFAVGGRVPFVGGASIQWGNRSSLSQPTTQEELPRVAFLMDDVRDDPELVNPIPEPEDPTTTVGPTFFAPFRAAKYIGYVIPGGAEDDYCRIFFDPDYPNSPSTEQRDACRFVLRRKWRNGSFDQVTLGNGVIIPAVGPRTAMANPAWHKPTFVIMDPCAGALASDVETCSRQCSRLLDRIGFVPPYCGKPIDPARLNRRNHRRWDWTNFKHDSLPLGVDLNNHKRTASVKGSWNNRFGPPGEQTITLEEETEQFIDRKFRMKAAGSSQEHGKYDPVSYNLTKYPLLVKQDFDAPKKKTKIWRTP